MAVAVPEQIDCVPLHGVRVHRITMAQTLDPIDGFIREGSPHHIVTLDASMCVMAREDGELLKIIRAAELVTPDSAGVLWACRRAGTPVPERVSGVEIVDRLCALSAERGYRLFFFGSAPGVTDDAAARLRERYPSCQIVGTRNGFFSAADESAIVEEIRAARPDVLFVALGIPKQEKWIARNREALGIPVLVGVGGSFDVHSGRVNRAPRWMQRLNLEWLYRLAKNPRKIGKVMTLPKFVMMTIRSSRESRV